MNKDAKEEVELRKRVEKLIFPHRVLDKHEDTQAIISTVP
jgi:hypothetical protein